MPIFWEPNRQPGYSDNYTVDAGPLRTFTAPPYSSSYAESIEDKLREIRKNTTMQERLRAWRELLKEEK